MGFEWTDALFAGMVELREPPVYESQLLLLVIDHHLHQQGVSIFKILRVTRTGSDFIANWQVKALCINMRTHVVRLHIPVHDALGVAEVERLRRGAQESVMGTTVSARMLSHPRFASAHARLHTHHTSGPPSDSLMCGQNDRLRTPQTAARCKSLTAGSQTQLLTFSSS